MEGGGQGIGGRGGSGGGGGLRGFSPPASRVCLLACRAVPLIAQKPSMFVWFSSFTDVPHLPREGWGGRAEAGVGGMWLGTIGY